MSEPRPRPDTVSAAEHREAGPQDLAVLDWIDREGPLVWEPHRTGGDRYGCGAHVRVRIERGPLRIRIWLHTIERLGWLGYLERAPGAGVRYRATAAGKQRLAQARADGLVEMHVVDVDACEREGAARVAELDAERRRQRGWW